MLARVTILKKNKQLIELFGLYDRLAGNFVNGAGDLTATLKDAAGADVTGLIAVGLTYINGSNGDYRGSVGAAFDGAAATTYTLAIESNGTGIDFELPATVKVRTTE